MPPVDKEMLVELMQRFETGADLDSAHPFGEVDAMIQTQAQAEAFLSTGVVEEVRAVLPHVPDAEPLLSTAIAAFFQGLAIGFEYAMETT